ncbi:peptide transporter mtd1 [Moniliophthora roreri MCA 2997]|uniref:Peptide transporter mtd1 n=1 Tax=Moniliophthora roreri (strain MCA 2997) TaxID=1381753 RepID=V2X7N6_MONRO|nr:peptide transporter mtd1 [Moniliophthora roreri MCA 2997]
MSTATPLTSISEKVDGLPTLDHEPDNGKNNQDFEKVDSDSEGHETYKGEPIITNGVDVSKFIVDLRDDGDDAVTIRSLVLGTIIAGLGAALVQIYYFKPVVVSVSTVFLLLVAYTIGEAMANILPRRSTVEGTRFQFLGPVVHAINPGPFGLKEHVVATLIASTAAYGSAAVNNFAVQRLFYDTNVSSLTAILGTFSTACFGMGLVGILRPLTVYPSEMVYWGNLPTVSVFQALHFDTVGNAKRKKLFWGAFTGMFVWELIPAYIFPLLNGFSVFCLASQRAPRKVRDVFTNVFGGAEGNEGLGLLSISLDWQYIGSMYMSLPLIQQANSWVGYFICYIAVLAIYYSDTWNSRAFPMLSTSIFNSNGTRYQQAAVFGDHFVLNQTALEQYGLPALTGSNAWSHLVNNLGIGGLIAHVVLFWGGEVRDAIKQGRERTQPDPHYQAMLKYKEVPWWWYQMLLFLSFFAGLIVVIKGQTTLPWWSYIIALLVGMFITPFSTILYGRMGNGVATNQVMKMVAGAINPGRPVANLYFSMWSHDVVSTSIGLAGDLKIGQYLKVPPRVMFLTQLWGTILGVAVNYIVMITVVDSQRETLLDPQGTNVWSGQTMQNLNSAAVTWSLAKELYGPDGPYFVIPMGLLLGAVPTIIQWLMSKRWPVIGGVRVDSLILPIVWNFANWMTTGVTSVMTSIIAVGLVSQLWLRRYHPGWYKKYNYILGGALDGGAQVMIFVLAFAVFGASGVERPFPAWVGNPAKGNVDYCNGNGALDD